MPEGKSGAFNEDGDGSKSVQNALQIKSIDEEIVYRMQAINEREQLSKRFKRIWKGKV
jgi:hypothetical protein